jgi:hypothetical protein
MIKYIFYKRSIFFVKTMFLLEQEILQTVLHIWLIKCLNYLLYLIFTEVFIYILLINMNKIYIELNTRPRCISIRTM